MNQRQRLTNQNNIWDKVAEVKRNPNQFLSQNGVSLPQNINPNDSNAILGYLMQTGKLTQDKYNGLYNQAINFTQMFNR